MRKRELIVGISILATGVLILIFLSRSPQTQPETSVSTASRGENSESVVQPAISPSPAPTLSERDHQLVKELDSILASKNDNDRRLDTDFRNLTPGAKTALIQRYQQMASEARNDRGTIVFLIGRELNRPEDFHFLAQVALEQPCLSLADCKQEMHQTPEEVHEQAAISVTLAYPQHVAMKSLENLLNQQQGATDPDKSKIAQALSTLDAMGNSPLPFIAQKAADLKSRYSQLPH